jgi:atypical dual specificity phosphatase
MSLFHKLAFYPSLLYGITLEKLGLRTWYTRIDDCCVIGALPLYNNYKYIVQKENIKGVVTLNEDYELK